MDGHNGGRGTSPECIKQWAPNNTNGWGTEGTINEVYPYTPSPAYLLTWVRHLFDIVSATLMFDSKPLREGLAKSLERSAVAGSPTR